MQGQCDQYPQRFVSSAGKIQFRYNIREIEVEDEAGPRITYQYDYAEAGQATSESILQAMDGVADAETILAEAGEFPQPVATEPLQ